jgi:hypothetical protein
MSTFRITVIFTELKMYEKSTILNKIKTVNLPSAK